MPDLPVSETVLLAWICGEESKFMEGLKMNQVNSKVIAFDLLLSLLLSLSSMNRVNSRAMTLNTAIAGCRHVHDDSEEILGRPNDPKTQELSLHLLVQPTLHWWILQRHWNRWHSGNITTTFHPIEINIGCCTGGR